MTWACCKNGSWKYSKDINGRQTRRIWPGGGRIPKLSWLDDVKFDFKEYGCEKIKNESFGQNRIGICREGNQGEI